MDFILHVPSPLGGMTLASDGEALVGLWFDGQKHFAHTLNPVHERKSLAVFDKTEHWLNLYFSGQEPSFTPLLHLRGTSFQRMVWRILLSIPWGKTMTYSEIAAQMAQRMGVSSMSPQAVGNAVGYNPISLIIPCHRVIGADGSLTGYAGGIERKRFLLQSEHSFLSSPKPLPNKSKQLKNS